MGTVRAWGKAQPWALEGGLRAGIWGGFQANVSGHQAPEPEMKCRRSTELN